jgi:ketosteroid isomerase-like protein
MAQKRERTLEERVQALEDALEIANLKATYVNGADGGWTFNPRSSDAEAIVPLFAQDGAWHSDSQGRAEGHAAIRKAWEKFSESMPFAFHTISNPIIRVDGDNATGEWHLFMRGTDAKGQEFWSAGIYQDEFVRTPDGWRVKQTHPRLVFLGPYNQSWKVLMESAKRAEGGDIPPEWKQMHDRS